jgi:hypothetical protein
MTFDPWPGGPSPEDLAFDICALLVAFYLKKKKKKKNYKSGFDSNFVS